MEQGRPGLASKREHQRRTAAEASGARSQAGFVLRSTTEGTKGDEGKLSSARGRMPFALAKDGDLSNLWRRM